MHTYSVFKSRTIIEYKKNNTHTWFLGVKPVYIYSILRNRVNVRVLVSVLMYVNNCTLTLLQNVKLKIKCRIFQVGDGSEGMHGPLQWVLGYSNNFFYNLYKKFNILYNPLKLIEVHELNCIRKKRPRFQFLPGNLNVSVTGCY